MAKRRDLLTKCKSTFYSQKSRALKKYNVTALDYRPEDLASIVKEKCEYCGTKLIVSVINFDHRVPVSRGGAWDLTNLSAICAKCNRRKGELTDSEYKNLLYVLKRLETHYGNDFMTRDVLKRLSAGAAFIHA